MIATPISQTFLDESLLYQRFHPHIHCFTFTQTTQESIDAAYHKIIELDQDYARNDQHIQYMFVLDDVTSTAHMLLKLQKSVAQMPDNLVESVAVVSDSFISSVLERMIMPHLNFKSQNQQTRFFPTEARAFAWLADRRETIGK